MGVILFYFIFLINGCIFGVRMGPKDGSVGWHLTRRTSVCTKTEKRQSWGMSKSHKRVVTQCTAEHITFTHPHPYTIRKFTRQPLSLSVGNFELGQPAPTQILEGAWWTLDGKAQTQYFWVGLARKFFFFIHFLQQMSLFIACKE